MFLISEVSGPAPRETAKNKIEVSASLESWESSGDWGGREGLPVVETSFLEQAIAMPIIQTPGGQMCKKSFMIPHSPTDWTFAHFPALPRPLGLIPVF